MGGSFWRERRACLAVALPRVTGYRGSPRRRAGTPTYSPNTHAPGQTHIRPYTPSDPQESDSLLSREECLRRSRKPPGVCSSEMIHRRPSTRPRFDLRPRGRLPKAPSETEASPTKAAVAPRISCCGGTEEPRIELSLPEAPGRMRSRARVLFGRACSKGRGTTRHRGQRERQCGARSESRLSCWREAALTDWKACGRRVAVGQGGVCRDRGEAYWLGPTANAEWLARSWR